jgi:hypothetical protein
MRPIWKKALIAVAAKKGWDAYQERRHQPSTAARVGKVGLLLALGAGAAYVVKTNRLQPLIDQIKGNQARPELPDGYGAGGNGNPSQPATTTV